jgi:hypothetical protein
MGSLGNTLSSSNHDSPIGAFLEPIDKVANPLSWATGGKLADFENQTLPDATNRALAPITQAAGSIDQKINPLRRIGAVNNVMNTLEAKPGDAIGLAIGSFFSAGALDGALAGGGGAAGAGTVGAADAGAAGAADAGTAAAVGAGASDASMAAALGGDAGAAGAADGGIDAGALGIEGAGTGGGDAVGMGTAATNANDFGMAGQLTTSQGALNGSFTPLAANTALPAAGPVGFGGGSSIGTQSFGAQLGKFSKGLSAVTSAGSAAAKAGQPAPATVAPQPIARRGVNNAMVIPTPLPMMQSPGASMMAMPGATALPTSNSSYQSLLNNMLANETHAPTQGLIGSGVSNSYLPGAGSSMNPGYLIPGQY